MELQKTRKAFGSPSAPGQKKFHYSEPSKQFYLRAIAHAADPLWESKVGVAFGMVNLDTYGPTKNQNDCFNFL